MGHEYIIYDDMSQLIREDNFALNATYLYTYDNAGNILTKSVCPYTAEGVIPVPTTTYNYEYNNSSWGDQLTRFGGGNNILYDEVGNPILYSNSQNPLYIMSWTGGRQLSSVQVGVNTKSYEYNGDGVRVYKYADGRHTYYFVEGTRIIYELTGSDILYYLYDADGSPIGMKYLQGNGIAPITYFYEKNIQGDIVGIRDVFGELLASYVYDAWGNFTATYYGSAQFDEIVLRNPYLYRGYYYDYETGFYYLNSRYYDPVTGRFINPDNIAVLSLTPDALTDKNLYAYCDNNPVMRADRGGEFWHIVAGAVIGGVVGFVSTAISTAMEGEFNLTKAFVSAGVGALSGGLMAAGVPVGAMIAINAGLGAAESVFENVYDVVSGDASHSVGEIISDAFISAGTAALFTYIGGASNGRKMNQMYRASQEASKTFVSTGVHPNVRRAAANVVKNYYTQLGREIVSNGYSSVLDAIGSNFTEVMSQYAFSVIGW